MSEGSKVSAGGGKKRYAMVVDIGQHPQHRAQQQAGNPGV